MSEPPDTQYSLLFCGQFQYGEMHYMDPADYKLNAEGRHLVGRISSERNRDALSRLAKGAPVSPRSSNPFVNYTKLYKSYSEQRKLELTEAEKLEVFGIVTSVFEYTNDKRKVVLASHLIVKLFCDLIAAQLEHESQGMEVLPHCTCQILTFCLKMLRSDYVCVRRHVFEILFNLSIHLNLLHHKTQAVEVVAFSGTTPPGAKPAAAMPSQADRPQRETVSPPTSAHLSTTPPTEQFLRRRSYHSASTLDSEDDQPHGLPPHTTGPQPSSHGVGTGQPGEGQSHNGMDHSEGNMDWCVERIQRFHRELVWVLHELLHYMVTMEEIDETVWWAAASCWLMMVSNTNDPLKEEVAEKYFPFFGFAETDKLSCPRASPYPTDVPLYALSQVDVRALWQFLKLKQVHLDSYLHTYFLHLLCMALFLPQDDRTLSPSKEDKLRMHSRSASRQAELVITRLTSIGGINTVIDLYVNTQSYSARMALFSVVYFYAAHLLQEEEQTLKNVPPKHALRAIWRGYCALRTHHLPWYLPQIFLYLPPNFVEILLQHALRQMNQEPNDEEGRWFHKYTKPWVLAVVFALRHLAIDYLKVEPAFMTEVKTMLVETEKTHRCFDLLTQLLTSVHADDRAQGEAWLFALMKNVFEADKLDSTIAAIMSVKQRVEQVLNETLSMNSNPQVRRIFISVTSKFVLLVKSKLVDLDAPPLLSHIHKLLNSHFFILCLQGEKDLDNLLTMYYVLMHHLCRIESPVSSARNPRSLSADTVTDLFLEGAVSVSLDFLVEIQLDVLKYLLLTLTQQQAILSKASDRHEYVYNPTLHHVRRTLMLLVLEHAYHCDASYRSLTLDFFQYFLMDPYPAIGLHASSFILHRLRRAGHDVYRKYFSKAYTIAQQQSDTEILENPYFLSCILMEHMTEFPPLPDVD